jgi:energy-converting hydrogenase Eha subunit F
MGIADGDRFQFLLVVVVVVGIGGSRLVRQDSTRDCSFPFDHSRVRSPLGCYARGGISFMFESQGNKSLVES